MDPDLLQSRLDYFTSLNYLSYHSDTKQHPLLTVTLLLVLKVYSMHHGLSFPRVTTHNIKNAEIPAVYTTELGDQIFIKYLEAMSTELFEMVAPVFKGMFTPSSFVYENPRTMQNLKGEVGTTTRTKPKPKITVHLLVDNSKPFEYLQSEYIYDTMYEARTFINKLVAYVPPSRMELYRVRVDKRTGRTRRDEEPILISKKPYKM